MFEQTSLFSEKSSAPLENLLSVIDGGAENNTWILLSGGSSAGNANYRPGDEFENSNNAIVDLIHWGWFDNRTVFVTYKRELSREKGSRIVENGSRIDEKTSEKEIDFFFRDQRRKRPWS